MSNKYKSEFSHGIKLAPEHFPVGTHFLINQNLHGRGKFDGVIFEAERCVYNAPGSFVVVTTAYDPIAKTNHAYNSDHVRAIVKRGSGEVVCDGGGGGKSPRSMLQRQQCRGSYLFYIEEIHDIVNHELKRIIPVRIHTEYLDIDLLIQKLLSQSFVRIHTDSTQSRFGQPLQYHSCPKKRIRRWLKQNFNRFKRKARTVEAEYGQMMDDIYREDMERGLDALDALDYSDRLDDMVKQNQPVVFEDVDDVEYPTKVEMAQPSVAEESVVVESTPKTEGAGRYSIGQEIYVMSWLYTSGKHKSSSWSAPHMYGNPESPDGVKFVKLTVTEHHKVRSEYDEENSIPRCDGYIAHGIVDGVTTSYCNQFPRASYGQVTDTGDRIFKRDCRGLTKAEIEDMIDNDVKNPYTWITLDDHIPQIWKAVHGEDREKLLENNPALHPLLTNLYKMVVDQFEATFPGKTIEVVPYPIKEADGSVRFIPGINKVEVIDKPEQA